MRVFTRELPGSAIIEVFIFQDRGNEIWIQRQRMSETPTYEFFCKDGESGPAMPRPSFYLPTNTARALVDALSGSGFMPGETGQIRGELTATKLHLEDMRKIAMTALELDNKKVVNP